MCVNADRLWVRRRIAGGGACACMPKRAQQLRHAHKFTKSTFALKIQTLALLYPVAGVTHGKNSAKSHRTFRTSAAARACRGTNTSMLSTDHILSRFESLMKMVFSPPSMLPLPITTAWFVSEPKRLVHSTSSTVMRQAAASSMFHKSLECYYSVLSFAE